MTASEIKSYVVVIDTAEHDSPKPSISISTTNWSPILNLSNPQPSPLSPNPLIYNHEPGASTLTPFQLNPYPSQSARMTNESPQRPPVSEQYHEDAISLNPNSYQPIFDMSYPDVKFLEAFAAYYASSVIYTSMVNPNCLQLFQIVPTPHSSSPNSQSYIEVFGTGCFTPYKVPEIKTIFPSVPPFHLWIPHSELHFPHIVSLYSTTLYVLRESLFHLRLRQTELLQALVLLERAVQGSGRGAISGKSRHFLRLSTDNASMALVVALLLSNKLNSDRPYMNKHWAKMFGIGTDDIAASEVYFLLCLAFRTTLDREDLKRGLEKIDAITSVFGKEVCDGSGKEGDFDIIQTPVLDNRWKEVVVEKKEERVDEEFWAVKEPKVDCNRIDIEQPPQNEVGMFNPFNKAVGSIRCVDSSTEPLLSLSSTPYPLFPVSFPS